MWPMPSQTASSVPTPSTRTSSLHKAKSTPNGGTHVDLSGKDITSLDLSFGGPSCSSPASNVGGWTAKERAALEMVTSLDVSRNNLTEIPRELSSTLPRLAEINASRNLLNESATASTASSASHLHQHHHPHHQLFFPRTLVRLDVSHNQLSSITDLVVLSRLQYLDVSYNRIMSFGICRRIVHPFPELVELKVSNNWIKSLRGVECITSLESVDARCNSISFREDAAPLENLPNLKCCFLEGNPLLSNRHATNQNNTNHVGQQQQQEELKSYNTTATNTESESEDDDDDDGEDPEASAATTDDQRDIDHDADDGGDEDDDEGVYSESDREVVASKQAPQTSTRATLQRTRVQASSPVTFSSYVSQQQSRKSATALRDDASATTTATSTNMLSNISSVTSTTMATTATAATATRSSTNSTSVSKPKQTKREQHLTAEKTALLPPSSLSNNTSATSNESVASRDSNLQILLDFERKSNDQLRHELDQLRQLLRNTRTAVNAGSSSAKSLKTENEALKKQVASLEQQVSKEKIERSALKKRFDDRMTRIDSERKRVIAAQEEEIQELRLELDAATSMLSSATTSYPNNDRNSIHHHHQQSQPATRLNSLSPSSSRSGGASQLTPYPSPTHQKEQAKKFAHQLREWISSEVQPH